MPLMTCVVHAYGQHTSALHFLSTIAHPQAPAYSGLQVNQDRSGNISGIVALVVKHIFAVTALRGKVLEVTVLADAMFLAELLPKLTSNYIARKIVSVPDSLG